MKVSLLAIPSGIMWNYWFFVMSRVSVVVSRVLFVSCASFSEGTVLAFGR